MAFWSRKTGAGEPPPDAGAPLGHVGELLQECGRQAVPAVLLWPETQATSRATFAGVAEGEVVLANPSRVRESLLDPTLPICACFSHLGREYAFVSWFVRFAPAAADGEGASLTLKLPTRLAVSDNRAACRVPILPDLGLRLVARGPDRREVRPRATEIGLAGIGLECSDCGDPGWREGARVELALRLGGEEEDPLPPQGPLAIAAVVRRREGSRYGLFFPDCLAADGLRPPDELRRLFKTLEMAFLQRRAEQEEDLTPAERDA